VVRYLGTREVRARLRAVLAEVAAPAGQPVVVGSRRQPLAVVLSIEGYQALTSRAAVGDAVGQVIASSRLAGLEPTAAEIETLVAVDAGAVPVDAAIADAVARATVTAAQMAQDTAKKKIATARGR